MARPETISVTVAVVSFVNCFQTLQAQVQAQVPAQAQTHLEQSESPQKVFEVRRVTKTRVIECIAVHD